jgi:hypothetical protein
MIQKQRTVTDEGRSQPAPRRVLDYVPVVDSAVPNTIFGHFIAQISRGAPSHKAYFPH